MARLLETSKIDGKSESLGRVMALYERSFPENERGNLMNLIADSTGHGGVTAFFEGGAFLGFAGLLARGGIVHIIYFAIDESLRNNGYGASALLTMKNMYPGCRLIADVEKPGAAAANDRQRARRLDFYLKNGFEPTDIEYEWENEEYVILSHGGNVTAREFHEFWKAVYSSNPLLRDF